MQIPRNFFIIAFIPVVICFVILAIVFRIDDASTNFRKTVLHGSFRSVVVDKYIDESNRGSKNLKLKNSNGIRHTLTAWDWNLLWELSRIGDTIIKHDGDSVLSLLSTADDSVYTLHYNFNQAGGIISKRWED